MSWAQKLRDEGREEGREESREEGQRHLLLRLLQRRFGDLPQHVVARVQRAHTADLELWTDRLLLVSTLDELFA